MELDVTIEILKLVVPTIIALVSLTYVIKQRNVVKREISKKRYLEDAQSNLNEAIKFLKKISSQVSLSKDSDDWNEMDTIVWEILKASHKLKKKKIFLEVSYSIQDWGEFGKPYDERDTRTIRNLDEYESRWFIDLLAKSIPKRFLFIETDTRIIDYERARNF